MTDSIFFTPVRRLTAGEVAEVTGSRLVGPADAVIRDVAALASAGPGDLVFADAKRQAGELDGLAASAILCPAEIANAVPAGVAVLVSKAPQRAFAQIGRLLHPSAAFPASLTGEEGISPLSFIDPLARIEDGAVIEAGAVIGSHVEIGAGTVVAPHAVIGAGCRIGRNCFIGPNSMVRYALIGDGVIIHGGAQIGQDGFGYVPGRSGPEKMPQLGRVVIQNGVEIGAATTIDRGTLGDTVIGENTKIDNLCQIAHNVRLGRNCLLASHCGISGSVTVGDNVMFGGKVGIADHVTVGSNVQFAAASRVLGDVPSNSKWGGFPAEPARDWLRGVALLRRLAGERPKGKRNV